MIRHRYVTTEFTHKSNSGFIASLYWKQICSFQNTIYMASYSLYLYTYSCVCLCSKTHIYKHFCRIIFESSSLFFVWVRKTFQCMWEENKGRTDICKPLATCYQYVCCCYSGDVWGYGQMRRRGLISFFSSCVSDRRRAADKRSRSRSFSETHSLLNTWQVHLQKNKKMMKQLNLSLCNSVRTHTYAHLPFCTVILAVTPDILHM